MQLPEYLRYPALKKFQRRYKPGDYLFRQGDDGETMFILIEGTVALIAEWDGQEHVDSLLRPGEILGEKAVVSKDPYQRYFSARARTEAVALEMSLNDIDFVHELVPDLMYDIMKRSFQVAADRLERANYLIRGLRAESHMERLAGAILHFCRASGIRVARGIEVVLSSDSLFYYVEMEPQEIEGHLAALQKANVLVKIRPDYYLLTDERALMKYARTAKTLAKAAA